MSKLERATLDRELNELRDDILRLTSLVDTAIEKAMTALAEDNVPLAEEVVANDQEINLIRYRIEEEGLRILATQQPLAGDLRSIIAAIHIAVELERMGDHAAGIAGLVRRMERDESIRKFHKLPKMAARARDMVQRGINAYTHRDIEKATALIKRDDKLNKHYGRLFGEALEEMLDPEYIRQATFLLWIGHNLERIGDRATNIAERVHFMVTGEFTETFDDID